MKPSTLAVIVALAGLSLAACAESSTSNGAVLGKKVAFLVPDARTDRFDSKDRPFFEAKVRSLCSSCQVIYGNANQDAVLQQKQAESALAGGAGAIVLDPVDRQAGSYIVAKAAKRGVPVIAYDQLIVNTESVKYFVGFDAEAVGVIQGTSLLKSLGSLAAPAIVMINGDPDDPEASLLKKGAHSVLDGKVKVANEYDAASWSPDRAKEAMSQALTAMNNKVDGVYAASDSLAAGAILALKEAKVKPLPAVTGADAQLDAIQRVVAGEQSMTVYKAVKQEAEAAAELAYQLVYGVHVPAATTNGKTVNNGVREVPALLVPPQEVTRKTLVSTVLADGFWRRSEICTAQYVTACRSAGIG
jgi:D-xylose transport system substrate-binding protein